MVWVTGPGALAAPLIRPRSGEGPPRPGRWPHRLRRSNPNSRGASGDGGALRSVFARPSQRLLRFALRSVCYRGKRTYFDANQPCWSFQRRTIVEMPIPSGGSLAWARVILNRDDLVNATRRLTARRCSGATAEHWARITAKCPAGHPLSHLCPINPLLTRNFLAKFVFVSGGSCGCLQEGLAPGVGEASREGRRRHEMSRKG